MSGDVTDIGVRPPVEEKYLGDGLYASYDGWQIRLRAPRYGGNQVVYLDPSVMKALDDFAKRCGL